MSESSLKDWKIKKIILSLRFIRIYFFLFLCSLFSFSLAQGAVSHDRDLRGNVEESNSIEPYDPFSQEANTFGKNDKIRAGRSGRFLSFFERIGVYSPSPKDIRFSQLIGKLIYNGNRGGCTASLIGEKFVLTAAHCLVKENKIKYGEYSFCLGYKDGDCIVSSRVTRSFLGAINLTTRADDWALLEVEDSLGSEYGYFGVKTLNALSEENNHVEQAGYGSDFFDGETLSRSTSCRIRSYSENSRLLYNDCDISRGDSGSPMLYCEQTSCLVVGLVAAELRDGGEKSLHLASYSSDRANIAVASKEFIQGVQDLRNNIYDGFLKPFEVSVLKKPDRPVSSSALKEPVLKTRSLLKTQTMEELVEDWDGRVQSCVDYEDSEKLEVRHRDGIAYFYSEERKLFLKANLCP